MFYGAHKERTFFQKLTSFMSSGPIVAMELIGPQAIKKWRDTLGPTDSETARKEAPGSLRASFGTDGITENSQIVPPYQHVCWLTGPKSL